MYVCELCQIEKEEKFASGRFCSLKCSRSFSTQAKRKEINAKVSKTACDKIERGERFGFCKKHIPVNVACKICGTEIITRSWKLPVCSNQSCRREHRAIGMRGKTGGYRHGSGRGKSGWYCGYWCDSTWELAYVVYCIENDIPIRRNTQRFPYEFENRISYYIPDFIVNGRFVEIKGYMTERMKAKLAFFPKKIDVLLKDDLKDVFDYVIGKYGTDYYLSLYETGDDY